MSQFEAADNTVASDTKRAMSAYVPPLQRTEGQPPPIAAHGGLSYMSFDQSGDAGTAIAIQAALATRGVVRTCVRNVAMLELEWG